jgi:hypothetical protein
MLLVCLLHAVADLLQFQHGGLSEKEAEERVKKINVNSTTLERFAGTANTIQAEGIPIPYYHFTIPNNYIRESP